MIKQLEKLKQGSISFQPQEAARRLIIHRLCLSALALPAPGGAEEAAALPALSVRLFPRPSPAGGAAPPRPRLRPSPAAGSDRAPRSAAGPDPQPGLPGVAPDVPPPPLAGAPWNSMTPGGAGRAAVPAPALPPPTASPCFPPGTRRSGKLSCLQSAAALLPPCRWQLWLVSNA